MNLNIDQHIIDSLDELARRERRSRSMMANLLLEEALMGALTEPGIEGAGRSERARLRGETASETGADPRPGSVSAPRKA